MIGDIAPFVVRACTYECSVRALLLDYEPRVVTPATFIPRCDRCTKQKQNTNKYPHIHTYTYTYTYIYRFICIYGFGCICVGFRGSRVCASERGHSVLMFPVLGSSVATQRPAVRAHPSCWFIHATSCPQLCPRYLGHRCGHVVVDKPAEIRPRRGRRHRNWMYPTWSL